MFNYLKLPEWDMCSGYYSRLEDPKRNDQGDRRKRYTLGDLVADINRVFVPFSGFRRIRAAYERRLQEGGPEWREGERSFVYQRVAVLEAAKLIVHTGALYALYECLK